MAPEIWAEIISLCPQADSSRLRLVSHVFDNIARHRVFSDISFLVEEQSMGDCDYQTRAERKRRRERNTAILGLITSDPSFTRMVKKLSIVVLHMNNRFLGRSCFHSGIPASNS